MFMKLRKGLCLSYEAQERFMFKLGILGKIHVYEA